MEPVQLSTREAVLYVTLINTAIGFFLGLLPLLFGYFNKRLRLGVFGIIATTVGGAILGIFLSVPATVVFTWLVVRGAKTDGSAGPSENEADDA